jgi:NAD-dependent dihydropyrimidine dehydrogenase PreA subunit
VATRQIIMIDEEMCTGCGECVPACAEGALEIIEGKARVVAEVLCDGLGACIGECPEGALTIVEREADAFDEDAVEVRLREIGRPSLSESGHAHAAPTQAAHAPGDPAPGDPAKPLEMPHLGCPGSLARELRNESAAAVDDPAGTFDREAESLLQNWPVQLGLINPNAPFLRHADLLIAADCAPTAYRLFHEDFLRGRSLVIACPKLDDAQAHYEKLALLLQTAKPRSVTVVRMEVPCCSGLVALTRAAAELAEIDVPVEEIVISVGGEQLAHQAAAR